jgi:hypothetical protein
MGARVPVNLTCDRCEMTVSFAAGTKNPVVPTTWATKRGKSHCLACRRDLAGEAAADALASDATPAQRLKARSHGRLEFELQRDPSRQDNRIASSCHTSVVAVRKARERLGLRAAERV